MAEVYAALAPVFILIALGWAARNRRVATPEQFGVVNRFGYFILYPAFLFTIVTGANFSNRDAAPFVLAVLAGFAAMMILALAMRLAFRDDGPAFTSVFQGALRWNGFPLLAAAAALYGPLGEELIGIVFGPLVFAVNIASVIVLSRWGANRAANWRAVLDQIIANPLILACAAGLLAQTAGVTHFGPVSEALRLLGQAAMPVALLTVGAGLDFAALRADGVKVTAATILKLIVAPAMLWLMATVFGVSPGAVAIAVGIGATPTAAAGYTLAREMGGDARLVAAIITATTLVSFVTMPLAISLALSSP
ncbi:MAG: AEC family transporter [Hyphomonadaceae bacterium]|nr:AEC family transporter [Hyphomonadaceae bacterium]